MRRYGHKVVVSQAGGGSRDPVTGVWVVNPESVLYEGPADVIDEPIVLARDASGMPTLTADGTITFPVARGNEELLVANMKAGNHVIDYFRDMSRDAEVVRVLRAAAQINVRFS